MASSFQTKKLLTQIVSIASIIAFLNVILVISRVKVEKAVMHTFYEKTAEAQDDVLQIWKNEWHKAGFNTKVLTLDDAKEHPYFEEMKETVQPLFDSSNYHALCYYRWLAMAAVGGGWMSDYDAFPTNFPLSLGLNLPNGGNFTSFEVHVPSLMSGRAEEWTRVAQLLVDAVPRSKGRKTDIEVFKSIRDEGNDSIHFYSMYNVQVGFVYKSWREVDCEKMMKGIAVHMSHSYNSRAYNKGLFPIENLYGTAADNRAKAISIFMDDWREQCKAVIEY